jgi:predicted RNA-binding protein
MNFCFICSDSSIDVAWNVFLERINQKKWPIYDKTRNKELIKKNDRIIFYIAGKNEFAKNFVGSAEVEGSINMNSSSEEKRFIEKKSYIYEYIKLENIKKFEKKINIYSVLNKLNFIKYKANYGLNLQGGCNVIDDKDYDLIIQQSYC